MMLSDDAALSLALPRAYRSPFQVGCWGPKECGLSISVHHARIACSQGVEFQLPRCCLADDCGEMKWKLVARRRKTGIRRKPTEGSNRRKCRPLSKSCPIGVELGSIRCCLVGFGGACAAEVREAQHGGQETHIRVHFFG